MSTLPSLVPFARVISGQSVLDSVSVPLRTSVYLILQSLLPGKNFDTILKGDEMVKVFFGSTNL